MRKKTGLALSLVGFVLPVLTSGTVFAKSSPVQEWKTSVNNTKNAQYIQLQENYDIYISFTDPTGKLTKTSMLTTVNGTLHQTGKNRYDEYAKVADNQGDNTQLYVKAGKEYANDGSGWKASANNDGSVLTDEFAVTGVSTTSVKPGAMKGNIHPFTIVPSVQAVHALATTLLANMGNEKALKSNPAAWADVLAHSTMSVQGQTTSANGKEVVSSVTVAMEIHLSPSEAATYLGFPTTSGTSNGQDNSTASQSDSSNSTGNSSGGTDNSSAGQSGGSSGGPMDITVQETYKNTYEKVVVPAPSGLKH